MLSSRFSRYYVIDIGNASASGDEDGSFSLLFNFYLAFFPLFSLYNKVADLVRFYAVKALDCIVLLPYLSFPFINDEKHFFALICHLISFPFFALAYQSIFTTEELDLPSFLVAC